VKLQRLVAASSVLCGRSVANGTDLWVLRHIWDTEEQREVIAAMVQEFVDKSEEADFRTAHPRARGDLPQPDELARELERVRSALETEAADVDRAVLRDQLGLLAGRCAWVADAQQRAFLEQKVQETWAISGGAP
jgi:MoxR-like ATPase